jgi:hypothetical protein
MPIQIRGELLLCEVASAHLWEGRFHFVPTQGVESKDRVKVLRCSAVVISTQQSALSNQQSAFSQETQPQRTQSMQKEIENLELPCYFASFAFFAVGLAEC